MDDQHNVVVNEYDMITYEPTLILVAETISLRHHGVAMSQISDNAQGLLLKRRIMATAGAILDALNAAGG